MVLRSHLGPPDPELARRHLLEFVRWSHPSYLAGWFHRELCATLEYARRKVGEIQELKRIRKPKAQ